MQQKLRETIETLRAEIEHLETGDTASKEKLEKLIADLESRLQASGDMEQPDVAEAVRDSITHFEVSHPRITGILNDLMMALSNMGI